MDGRQGRENREQAMAGLGGADKGQVVFEVFETAMDSEVVYTSIVSSSVYPLISDGQLGAPTRSTAPTQ